MHAMGGVDAMDVMDAMGVKNTKVYTETKPGDAAFAIYAIS